MRKILKIEFYKLCRNRIFWISIIIGCIIAIMHTVWVYNNIYISNNMMYEYRFKESNMPVVDDWFETGVLQGWLGTEGFSVYNQLFYLLFPLLAAMPYSLSLFQEWNSGYSGQVMVRCRKRDYFVSKGIVTFISGGIVVCIPLVLSLVMACCYLPVIQIDPISMKGMAGYRMWVDIYMKYPVLYAMGYMCIDFVYGGIFAFIAMVVSWWCTNRFLSLVFPLIANIFTTMGIGSLFVVVNKYIPGVFINPIQHIRYEFNIVLIVTFSLIAILAGLYLLNTFKAEELE